MVLTTIVINYVHVKYMDRENVTLASTNWLLLNHILFSTLSYLTLSDRIKTGIGKK